MGFTLVELLVVVGIIALLISILLPALGRARSAAQTVACLSNLRQIGMAWMQYRNENADWIPPASRKYLLSQPYSKTLDDNVDDAKWFNLLERYTKNYDVFNCRTMTNRVFLAPSFRGTNTAVLNAASGTAQRGWAPGGSSPIRSCNYAYAYQAMGLSEEIVGTNPLDGQRIKKFSTLKRYATMTKTNAINVAVVVDGMFWTSGGGYTYFDSLYLPQRFVHGRNDRLNALFTDGRALTMRRAPSSTPSSDELVAADLHSGGLWTSLIVARQ